MKSKDETTKLLIDFITRFETATGRTIKCICSDNSGKFKSKKLADFIASKGIRMERSLPYHHFQNGAIERYNQSVAEIGRSVLTESNLPRGFWGFAFLWANYTLNRLPKKVSGHKTPFKAFNGYKPSVDHLRVFGSRAFILIPPEKRKKLNDCAVEAHVIGYIDGSKGWMFWIPKGN
jgi:transposase InsO family protein